MSSWVSTGKDETPNQEVSKSAMTIASEAASDAVSSTMSAVGQTKSLFEQNVADRILQQEKQRQEATYQSEGKALLLDLFRPFTGDSPGDIEKGLSADYRKYSPKGIAKGFAALSGGFISGLFLNKVSAILQKTGIVASVAFAMYYASLPEKKPEDDFKDQVKQFFEGQEPAPHGPLESFLELFLKPSQIRKLKDRTFAYWDSLRDTMNANKRLTILAATGAMVGILGL